MNENETKCGSVMTTLLQKFGLKLIVVMETGNRKDETMYCRVRIISGHPVGCVMSSCVK